MKRTVQETSERFDNVHARLNEGNENWKNKPTAVDAKVTEIEQLVARRESRIDMIHGSAQRMARGEAFPPAPGIYPVPAPPSNQHQSYVMSAPLIAPKPINHVFFCECGAPQAPMGGPFMNVPTLAEVAAQANG